LSFTKGAAEGIGGIPQSLEQLRRSVVVNVSERARPRIGSSNFSPTGYRAPQGPGTVQTQLRGNYIVARR
jgi:hypothetical protein